MKKIITIFLTIVIASTSFLVPTVVRAKTLGDLQSELEAKQTEYNQNETKKNLTQAQINQTRNEIAGIQSSISQTYIDITNLNKEIEQLNKDIEEKNKEIKQIMNYVQLSNGESGYLEYAFGAKDFTDFIYRLAVAEQLTNYNDKLIAEYNNSIVESKKKQDEIANKRIQLEASQKNLQSKMESLGSELNATSDISISIKDEIAYQKELVAYYKSKGCELKDNISSCGKPQLPSGTALFRPIASGYVTSFYGNRTYDGWHNGIDLSTSISAPPVYAAGNGVVSAIWKRFYCGGNMVFIQHKINGVKYTTLYAHLLTINVEINDVVTRNTIVGYMGGGYKTTTAGGGWDSPSCTTGQHLHFQIANGLYAPDGTGDYSSYSGFTARTIDPSNVINFPGNEYSAFQDRTTAY